MVDVQVVDELLEEIREDLEDPEAQYEMEIAEEHVHYALQAEYLEKDSGDYDL